MAKEYQAGDLVVWKSSAYYGDDRPDEPATIVGDWGKDRVKIACQDGEERWVYRENVRRGLTLPDDLQQALLSTSEPVCSALIVNAIASVIVKAPSDEVASFRGAIPVLYRYELGRFEEGAVIRLYLEIKDRPASPYSMETFLNPAADHDLELLRQLISQAVLDIHFFDMAVNYVFSKRLRHRKLQRRELGALMDMALAHLQAVSPEQLNWQVAKAKFQRQMPLCGPDRRDTGADDPLQDRLEHIQHLDEPSIPEGKEALQDI